MQIAVAFDAGEIFLSQAVSPQQPVNLSYSSCLTCCLHKSIWGGFKELFFSSLCNLLISRHELFLRGQARKIRRIIFGICAIQLPWLCLWDYRGINVVHLEVMTETTEPWVLTAVPLLIHLPLTILYLIHCLFCVNILLNHSIKIAKWGNSGIWPKIGRFKTQGFWGSLLYFLLTQAPQSCLCIILLAYSIFTEWYFLCHQYIVDKGALQSLSSFIAFCLQAVIVLICVIEFLITLIWALSH